MIDKQFFDTFGIKPEKGCVAYDKFTEEEADAICNDKCAECLYLDNVYSKITDHILLELICIYNQYSHHLTIHSTKKEFLKNDILEYMIDIINYFYEHEMGEYSELKQQVRTLFGEVDNAR